MSRSPSHSLLIQVVPFRIILCDQVNLPLSGPALDGGLPLDGGPDIIVPFEVNQPLQIVFPRELTAGTVPMLPDPANQIVCYASIERAVQAVGEDVYPAACFLGH